MGCVEKKRKKRTNDIGLKKKKNVLTVCKHRAEEKKKCANGIGLKRKEKRKNP
jgi:hypothetical protein